MAHHYLCVNYFWWGFIPRIFNREALHLQQLSQRVILAVDYVLPLFVIQLLPHDVLTQVVHHLHKILDIRYHKHLQGTFIHTGSQYKWLLNPGMTISEGATWEEEPVKKAHKHPWHFTWQLTSLSVKTSSWAPATRRICRRGAFGCTWVKKKYKCLAWNMNYICNVVIFVQAQ